MSDDDYQRLERHYESLLKEYGVLKVEQIRHDERILEGKDDRAEIRREIGKLEGELLAAIQRSEKRTREHIERADKSCHEFRAEYRRDRDRASERREQEREVARKQLEREREEARKQLAQELSKAHERAQIVALGDREWSRRKKLAWGAAAVALFTGVLGSVVTAALTIFGGG